VPSFAEQAGLPCATCHVGAFGPQLKPFGRQFTLNGYTLDDGQDHLPPLSAMLQTSYTHTGGGLLGGTGTGIGNSACAACHPGSFGGGSESRDNVAADDVSLFLAGKLTEHVGAFAEVSFNGVSNSFHWNNIDVRYADSGAFLGKDLVYGVTVNNNPSVQDLWNSSPVWSFPFAQSLFAPASASFEDAYTVNARYFKTMGSTDVVMIGTPTGSPNSAGWLGEFDWAPNGNAGGVSYLPDWLNVKLSMQHVIYTHFDGTSVGATGNDATFFLAWFAVPFN